MKQTNVKWAPAPRWENFLPIPSWLRLVESWLTWGNRFSLMISGRKHTWWSLDYHSLDGSVWQAALCLWLGLKCWTRCVSILTLRLWPCHLSHNRRSALHYIYIHNSHRSSHESKVTVTQSCPLLQRCYSLAVQLSSSCYVVHVLGSSTKQAIQSTHK